jgi:hypothetical protein
MKPQDPPMAN